MIDRMSEDERFFAAAYLRHLAQVDDPVYQNVLAERLDRMELGKKVGLEQLRRVHEALEGEGL
jgi:hypothetical protein